MIMNPVAVASVRQGIGADIDIDVCTSERSLYCVVAVVGSLGASKQQGLVGSLSLRDQLRSTPVSLDDCPALS